MTSSSSIQPSGKRYGDSIIVNGDNVYLRVADSWFSYSKRRVHIGNGGMGSILLGHSLNEGFPVAIKRIKPQFTSRSNIRERIILESKLTYSHPNLVEILGCCEGPGENGPIFIISRFIQGQTIDIYVDSFFQKGESKIRHIITMMRQLASAVDFIHSKGIIHLDIKPSNIMVERGSNIKLLDLGIAEVTNHNVKTSGFGLLGTKGFAAPEQYVDETHPHLDVDNHTDIYGMAATTYSLIMGNTIEQINTIYESSLGVNLRNVFIKALSPIKENRYNSANEFVDALEEAYDKDLKKREFAQPLTWFIIGSVITVIVVLIFYFKLHFLILLYD